MKKVLPFLIILIPIILFLPGAINQLKKQKEPSPQPTSQIAEEVKNNVHIGTDVTPTAPTSTSSTIIITVKPKSKLNMDLSKYTTPIMIIDKTKTYTAKVKTTAGEIDLALNAAATPITVNNFVFLAKKNFYDNVIFHRTIPGFMIQGGDPTGTGSGGPGYQFDDEPFTGEYTRGTLAMANAGPNTNGSQFFIMHADNHLPPAYVIFGKVTKGLDVVDKIATAPTNPSGEGSRPIEPVKILSVEIIEK